jgi:hypothetical protein
MSSDEEPPRRRRSDYPRALLAETTDPLPPPVKVISDDVAKSLRKTLRILIGATVTLYLIMITFMVWTWTITRGNRVALCAVRLNAEVQRDQSTSFLKDHPKGIPGLVTAEDLQNGIDNYTATVTALGNLNC